MLIDELDLIISVDDLERIAVDNYKFVEFAGVKDYFIIYKGVFYVKRNQSFYNDDLQCYELLNPFKRVVVLK